jgi:hypothetical protein
LPVILSFIAQGNLKFNKNGNKIIAGSLKKMSEVCGIDEFYLNDDKELKFVKTKLLSEFFGGISPWKPKDLEDLPAFIKDKINRYFSFKEFTAHRCRGSFDYIKRQMIEFTHDVTIQSAKIEIDEHKTLLSIYGEDPIKQMALEAVGQRINKSSYMVNYQSFLKECYTRNEVENKIQFFRDNIVEKPPAIWEDFFRKLLARMNPLEPVPDLAVFRVKPDRELLRLLITDTLLKKYVIRAENQHLLIRTVDVSKVKKRLTFFGFFIS